MGIQDRDYYWEKHKEADKSNNSDFDGLLNRKPGRYQKNPSKSPGNLRYLLAPALMLFGLWHGADRLLKYRAAQQPASPTLSIPDSPAEPNTIQPISGGLIIKADRQGHFRGTVLINHIPMPFLIDTGATLTSIPANLAYAANLPVGAQLNAHTAGGQVVDRLTQISSLKIGNAEIQNLDAAINQHLEEVLIGMNTLKYFNMTQSGNTMTLVANGSSPEQIAHPPADSSRSNTMALEQAVVQPTIKRPTTIKKSVTCDAKQVCTTKYSDH